MLCWINPSELDIYEQKENIGTGEMAQRVKEGTYCQDCQTKLDPRWERAHSHSLPSDLWLAVMYATFVLFHNKLKNAIYKENIVIKIKMVYFQNNKVI